VRFVPPEIAQVLPASDSALSALSASSAPRKTRRSRISCQLSLDFTQRLRVCAVRFVPPEITQVLPASDSALSALSASSAPRKTMRSPVSCQLSLDSTQRIRVSAVRFVPPEIAQVLPASDSALSALSASSASRKTMRSPVFCPLSLDFTQRLRVSAANPTPPETAPWDRARFARRPA
jgi:hypothetical protein